MIKKCKRKVLVIFLILFVCLLCYYVIESHKLTVTSYTVYTSELESELRIVQLTDLHNKEFDKDNKALIEIIAQQQPDLIIMTGDMINEDDMNINVICNLTSKLSKIAPVYYGYGNNETSWEENWSCSLAETLSASGATVLNNDYIDVKIKGQYVRIGGYMGYYRQPGMFQVSDEERTLELEFADNFENTSYFKILLNHIPTQWVDWNYIDQYPVDIVLSGHYHGGMIRIPIINRGIYAPYVGLFPQYTKGVYSGSKATCILSSGLGSEYYIPRLNNPPEIVVVDLVPE